MAAARRQGEEGAQRVGGHAIRVVVASSTAVFGAGVRSVLEDAGIEVCGLADVDSVGVLVAQHAPDVAIVVIDGGDAAEAVARAAGTPVLMVGLGDPDHVVAAVRARAHGFVAVDEPTEALVDGVRTVASGRSAYPTGWQDAVLDLVLARGGDGPGGTPLTAREADIVALILEGRSNKEIARELGLAQQTIKNQLGHVMLKLGLSSRLQLYRWAAEHQRELRTSTNGTGGSAPSA